VEWLKTWDAVHLGTTTKDDDDSEEAATRVKPKKGAGRWLDIAKLPYRLVSFNGPNVKLGFNCLWDSCILCVPFLTVPLGGKARAALVSGPPGIGKTSAAVLACREAGRDVIEYNASDARSKRQLQQHVLGLLSSNAVSHGRVMKPCLVMDEVDGMQKQQQKRLHMTTCRCDRCSFSCLNVNNVLI